MNSGQAKAQPKPAAAAKTSRRGRRGARRGGRVSNRPKPKTTEELDAEMDDYFDTNENAPAEGSAAVNGQAQPATNGGGEDVGMAEISVSCVPEAWTMSRTDESSNLRENSWDK